MPKRSNGEGTICLRKDGKWVAAVSLGRKPDGRVNRKFFYGKTKREVREKMVACLHDQQRGIVTVGNKQTIATYINSWLEDVARPRIRKTTYRSYEQIIRNHIVPGLGSKQLNKLSPQDVQRFLKSVHDQGISCDPVRRVLRAALNQAVEWDLIVKNPAALKGIPKREPRKAQFLNQDESRQLLVASNNHRFGALFKSLMLLGLRIGEALALQWSDVNWEERTISIDKQLQFHDGEWNLVPPKSKQSNRRLPLIKPVLDALLILRETQKNQMVEHSERWVQTGFIFTTSIGTPLDSKNVRKEFKNLLEDAGLPSVRLHDLRHTHASLLLASGTPARVISELLGHAQVSFTMSVYAHAMADAHNEAASRLERQLFGNAEKPQSPITESLNTSELVPQRLSSLKEAQ